ncbi:MAG: dienelactone hydrolase family protein [Deltaproteobacteria bacterium]|nr:dienelactone hydrolase family protein [Deltaproteobacteria bacterium]
MELRRQAALLTFSLAFAGCGGSAPLGLQAEAPDEPDPPTRVPLANPSCRDCADVAVSSNGSAKLPVPNPEAVERPGVDSIDSPEPSAPVADPTRPGPYLPGVRTVEVTDPARNRTFLVDVWYPVSPDAPDSEPNEYRLDGLLENTVHLDSPARRDAPIAAGGAWPLVVFSHGFGGIRFQSWFMTEHLASHGFIVASPDHPGNRLTDFARLGSEEAQNQSAVDRPLDVIYVRDQMIPGGSIARETGFEVDPARVAASGHSFGGWTCLEVARRDAGFRAVLPLAPGFRHGVTPDMVAVIERPIGFFGGSLDHTTPFDENQEPAYAAAARPKALVNVIGAGHLDFSNLCDIRIARLFVNDGCDPAQIEPARVHEIVKTVSVAFLKRHLLGEHGYDAYLEDSFVKNQGPLDYWRDM